ncbi:hypothetical protein PBV87_06790 [Niameybacter massiliensis]|uniref:Uncharacterized protein n=1 Tax=Holtiella tumoricola TaxID=3018743 RepID=A0AA42J080_9FIRM|nr:hypothetical protein [Holtiella tumoricola]MDA3731192.1 hypothetical protein [Holtiella tumoricola]
MCEHKPTFCMNFGFFDCCMDCTDYADINCPYYKTKLTKLDSLIELYNKTNASELNDTKVIKP